MGCTQPIGWPSLGCTQPLGWPRMQACWPTSRFQRWGWTDPHLRWDAVATPSLQYWNIPYRLSESLAPVVLMRAQLKYPLKLISTILLWCMRDFRGAVTWGCSWYREPLASPSAECLIVVAFPGAASPYAHAFRWMTHALSFFSSFFTHPA